jgi:hypothetical protein
VQANRVALKKMPTTKRRRIDKTRGQSKLTNIPEILFHIFEYCDANTLHKSIPFVCSAFNACLKEKWTTPPKSIKFYERTCINENLLWKNLCRRDMPVFTKINNDKLYCYHKLYYRYAKRKNKNTAATNVTFYGYGGFIDQTSITSITVVSDPADLPEVLSGTITWLIGVTLFLLSPLNGNSATIKLEAELCGGYAGDSLDELYDTTGKFTAELHSIDKRDKIIDLNIIQYVECTGLSDMWYLVKHLGFDKCTEHTRYMELMRQFCSILKPLLLPAGFDFEEFEDKFVINADDLYAASYEKDEVFNK